MEDINKISPETLLKLDESFNIASLLGKAILAAQSETEASYASTTEAQQDKAQVDTVRGFEFQADEDEKEIAGQMRQLKAFFSPKIIEILRPSALYDMFMLSAERFGFDPSKQIDDYDSSCRFKAAIAWIIARRVFSVRHPEEAIRLINLPDSIKDTKPITFSPFDETDRAFVVEICNSVHVEDLVKVTKQSDYDKVLSQISASGKIMIPASKAFRKQREIALSGVERDLNVGRGAIIKASITGKDGKPLGLSMFEMDIEATIGQLFQENGFKTLCLSPAQIYRKYAELPSDATVSPAEIRETIEAMDKLIITPATLDFTEQIERHTRLKRRDGFDYENPKRRGTLITGVHDMNPVRTHNGYKIEDSFTIHEMPMFYAYSYAIGQIYTVPSNYLTGDTATDPTAKKIKTKKKSDQQRRISKEDVSLRRYLLEYIEYQKGEWEKRDRKLRSKHKPVPPFFEFDLPFESIARDIFKDNTAAQQRAEAAQIRAEAANKNKPQPKTKEGATEKQLRSLREQTYDFMCMQVKLGNISKCEYYKSGRSLRGVKIRL